LGRLFDVQESLGWGTAGAFDMAKTRLAVWK
jgi:hypothetical protein